MMQQGYALTARPDTSLNALDDGGLQIDGTRVRLSLGRRSSGEAAALKTLFGQGATEEELGYLVVEQDGPQALPGFYFLMHGIENEGIVCRTVRSGDGPLATIVPIGSQYRYGRPDVPQESPYVLSRFAYCRKNDGSMIIESPLSQAQIVLHDARASAMVHELANPHTYEELAQAVGGITADVAREFVGLLSTAGMTVQQGSNGKHEEDVAPPLATWEFHDLLFHSRSRLGRHNNPFGGTYRFAGTLEPQGALKPPMSDETVVLDRPDMSSLSETEPPFTVILEARRSIREYGNTAISRRQLGEFLYRTARVRKLIPTDVDELSNRPYPGGGALYELDLYPVIHRCEDLESGLYHYRPGEHALSRIPVADEHVNRLLELAWYTLAKESRPQVLIVIAARFPRVSWKYQSMAYSLILKHVGILYQTMYLVATAMGLAPCALGGGDAELFAAASGIDYLVEGSVGEFVLGSQSDTEVLT